MLEQSKTKYNFPYLYLFAIFVGARIRRGLSFATFDLNFPRKSTFRQLMERQKKGLTLISMQLKECVWKTPR